MKNIELRLSREYPHDYGRDFHYDIVTKGTKIGTLNVITYEDTNSDYNHCERIDIDDQHRGQGYGTATFEALRELFGSVVVAPDNADAQRLYSRLGCEWDGDDADYIDQGYGVYEI